MNIGLIHQIGIYQSYLLINGSFILKPCMQFFCRVAQNIRQAKNTIIKDTNILLQKERRGGGVKTNAKYLAPSDGLEGKWIQDLSPQLNRRSIPKTVLLFGLPWPAIQRKHDLDTASSERFILDNLKIVAANTVVALYVLLQSVGRLVFVVLHNT